MAKWGGSLQEKEGDRDGLDGVASLPRATEAAEILHSPQCHKRGGDSRPLWPAAKRLKGSAMLSVVILTFLDQ